MKHAGTRNTGAVVADPPEASAQPDTLPSNLPDAGHLPGEQPTPPPLAEAPAPFSLGDLLDPDAIQGTRFTGPILSGDFGEAAGIVLLHKRARITFANGNFSMPVKFPPSAILIQLIVQVEQAYNGTAPHLNLGTNLNGIDIANVDLTGVGPTHLFVPITALLTSSWTIYLSQVLTGSTAGKLTAMMTYSVPAKAIPN
jgi:hypothetical protein